MAYLLPVAFISIISCAQQVNSEESQETREPITLSGTVKNPQADGNVTLEEVFIYSREIETIDTIDVQEDGTFSLQLDTERPGFYRINYYGKQYVSMVLDQDDVTVNADGDSPKGYYEVQGSRDTEYLREITGIMQGLQEQSQDLNRQFMEARNSNDQQKMMNLQEDFKEMEQRSRAKIKSTIDSMGTSLSALLAVSYLDQDRDFPFIQKIAGKFEKAYPDAYYTETFLSEVNQMQKLAVGSEAPNIELPNPEGDTLALYSLQGDYVLIDFWAAWCRPCRMENPNVVRMYNKYKEKGFEIYGVSLDRNREDWVKAIEKDGLTWKHVSDLKYFNSEAASLYNVQAIPATYLIGPEGKILAKNLRGAALEAKLEEIFGS